MRTTLFITSVVEHGHPPVPEHNKNTTSEGVSQHYKMAFGLNKNRVTVPSKGIKAFILVMKEDASERRQLSSLVDLCSLDLCTELDQLITGPLKVLAQTIGKIHSL